MFSGCGRRMYLCKSTLVATWGIILNVRVLDRLASIIHGCIRCGPCPNQLHPSNPLKRGVLGPEKFRKLRTLAPGILPRQKTPDNGPFENIALPPVESQQPISFPNGGPPFLHVGPICPTFPTVAYYSSCSLDPCCRATECGIA